MAQLPPLKDKSIGRHYDTLRHFLVLENGYCTAEPIDVRLTRYSHGLFKSHKKKPGRKTAIRCVKQHEVFYSAVYQRFYIKTMTVDEHMDKTFTVLLPFNGRMYDTKPEVSDNEGVPVVELRCENGYPVSIRMDGEDMPMQPEYWAAAEDMLLLNRPHRKCGPRKRK